MTDEDLRERWIPLEEHTESEDRFLLEISRDIAKTFAWEEITEARTSMVFNAAVQHGFADAEARRLADHIDACTLLLNDLPEDERQRTYADMKARTAEFWQKSPQEREDIIKDEELAKAAIRTKKGNVSGSEPT